jgi:hypothetical protein
MQPPTTPALYPHYKIPLPVIAGLIFSWMIRQKRSFQKDAVRMLQGMKPKPIVTGLASIPKQQGCLLVINHYKRPNFATEWIPAAVSAAVGREMSWIMVNAWTYAGQRRGVAMRPIMRWVLGVIAKTYGFYQLPPNPPDPSLASQRGQYVRKIFHGVQNHPGIMLGLAPEGLDYPENTLGLPPPGAGRMIYFLSKLGLIILPAGIYEQDGFLKIQFGEPFELMIDSQIEKSALDLAVRRMVMQAILRQLPDSFQYDEMSNPL